MSRKMDDALGRIKKFRDAAIAANGKPTARLVAEGDKDLNALEKARKAEYDTGGSASTSNMNPNFIMSKKWKKDTIEHDIQRKLDDMLIVSTILKRDIKSLKMWDDFKVSELGKAMDTQTSGEGAEWVPTLLSTELVDLVSLPTNVEALFQRIPMPSNPFTLPLTTARPVLTLFTENTLDHSSATEVATTEVETADVTLAAKILGMQLDFSDSLSEDSIVPMVPTIRFNMGEAAKEGREKAIIDGDTSGTHQDSDVTSALDVRKAFVGLRKLSQASADLSTFTYDNILGLLKDMGVYFNPTDNAMIVGTSGMISLFNIKDSSGNQITATVDKYGSGAPILSGEIGVIAGVPIVRSQWIRENLNAAGVYDGTTTDNTILLVVHRPSIALGDRRDVRVEMAREIRTQQTIMVLTQRLAMSRVQAAANTFVARGYNIAS